MAVYESGHMPDCVHCCLVAYPHSSRPLPAGACVRPEGFPGAVCRGWTLYRCQLTCFCACGPGAPVPEAPGSAPGHVPATTHSATDLLLTLSGKQPGPAWLDSPWHDPCGSP